jgi:alkaline phosphatase
MLRVLSAVALPLLLVSTSAKAQVDHLRQLQTEAVRTGRAEWGHWGIDPQRYATWKTHSNRLIPVYTFGISLDAVTGENSPYRSAEKLRELYGRVPEDTLNPDAGYFDQTAVYELQRAALEAGKRYIVLIVFDGMDWQTTRAAAIYNSSQVSYSEGRGAGLSFLDYRAPVNSFGYFVTSPHNEGTKCDVDAQVIHIPGQADLGGYDWRRGGAAPWQRPTDPLYLLAKSAERKHAYTDSASSATSLTAGIKTYNDSVNFDHHGNQVVPIARQMQQQGYGVGVVTNVPISHATPAAAYANNVHRDDFQDISRELLGLPSITHRRDPLPGVDVLLGAGWGETAANDTKKGQGLNFVPGNKFLTADDLAQIDVARGGMYQVVQRTPGIRGKNVLAEAAREAEQKGRRLFGYFGVKGGHLPFRTADGKYDPVRGIDPAESYTPADIAENPTLAEMTEAALTVLSTNPKGFWLMIEPGDVDWANHDNNIDNSIGAVLSGDEAVRTVVTWVETRDAWRETAVIVTADHGHYLVLERPEALVGP